MNAIFKSWWRARTFREQMLLIAMAGLMALVFAWMLVVRPLGDALAVARQRHDAAMVSLGQVRMQAELIAETREGAPPKLDAPLDALISQGAVEAGFPVKRVDQEGPGIATIVIDSVRPQAFFGWINRMEGRGLIVDRLSATANNDQTLSVQATFRTRSG